MSSAVYSCYVLRRDHTMEFIYLISLMMIFIVNILFFFSRICLNNCLVILSFWRSAQLRKKLCYSMIMVLSCCDFLALFSNHPTTSLTVMLWFTEKIRVYPSWLLFSNGLSNMLFGFSLLALLVMSFDRYLATHYPIFHRTSVTKGKLLTFFAFLIFIELIVVAMSTNSPYEVGLLTFCIIFIPPMLLINNKLFTVATKSRGNNGISIV